MTSKDKAFASNVRPSFFGGVVSSRLACQGLAGAIVPVPSKKAATKQQQPTGQATQHQQRSQDSGSATSSTHREPLITDAERAAVLQKRRAAAEQRQQQLAQLDQAQSGTFKPHARASAAAPRSSAAAVPRVADAPKAFVSYGSTGTRFVTHAMPAAAQQARQPRSHAQASRTGSPARPSSPAGKFPTAKGTAHGKGSARSRLGRPYSASPGLPGASTVKLAYDGPQQDAAAPPAGVPGRSKPCRRCAQVHPLSRFFVDRRTEDGFMHYCAQCAQHQGLSGRLPSAEKLAAARQRAVAASPHRAKQPAAPSAQSAQRAFYASNGKGAPRAAPAVAAVRAGAPAKRQREVELRRAAEEEYDADFVEDDDEGGEDWRKELASVTRAFYREDRAVDDCSGRAMEASAADIRREEARSRALGRREDQEAEREELKRAAEKEARLERAAAAARRAKRKGKHRGGSGGGGGAHKAAKMFLEEGGASSDEDASDDE